MRGEEKPYDMQAPCNDTEFAEAIKIDRKLENISSLSIIESSSANETPTITTTIHSTPSAIHSAPSILSNEIASIMETSSKPLNLPITDLPVSSFSTLSPFVNTDIADQKDHEQINETNVINKSFKLTPNFGGKLPQTINLPTFPLPLTSTAMALPTLPVSLYNAKLPIPPPKIVTQQPNVATPLLLAVHMNADQRYIPPSLATAKSYIPFQSTTASMVTNNPMTSSMSVSSVESSTMSLSPCPSSTGSSSSPHSTPIQGVNGPTTSIEIGIPSENIPISPSLHLRPPMVTTHLPHSLDSLLTPAASPEEDSLEPWIQTV